MTFSDIFKSSFLENVTSVSPIDMVLALALAFGLGLFNVRKMDAVGGAVAKEFFV